MSSASAASRPSGGDPTRTDPNRPATQRLPRGAHVRLYVSFGGS